MNFHRLYWLVALYLAAVLVFLSWFTRSFNR